MATVAPFPLLPPISTELRLAHFDEQVYTATPDTLLYKFVDAICGTTGAGSLLNQSFMTRLTNALETIYFNDLDYIFSKINFLGRSPAESYPYNPMTDMLTSAQWDEVRVKDAWYRARIKDFFAACSLGGTPMGIRMCVQAAVGTDCTLLETWRYLDSFGLGDNLGRSAVSARNEITVRPRKDELSPEEFRLLRDMLDRISPMETIVTINLKGLSMLAPVKISSINASSTYFEVQKSVTASPVIKTMTATDLNLQDTLNESEQWLFDAIDDPKDAPYSAFNITSEHCLAGDTGVLTPRGVVPIKDLSGGTHKVMTPSVPDGKGGRGPGRWVDAEFRSYGDHRLWKIILRRNGVDKTIHATSQHRWFVRRENGSGSYRDEVRTANLVPGQRLSYIYHQRNLKTSPSPIGVAHGFVWGDGTARQKGSFVTLHGEKDKALLPYFEMHRIVESSYSHNGSTKASLTVLDLPGFFKTLVDLSESPSYLYGWLAGYFAADGHVSKTCQVQINSNSLKSLEHVRAVCNLLGIHTTTIASTGFGGGYGSREGYVVRLDKTALTSDFFIIDEHRRRWLDDQAKPVTRRDYKGHTVVSVEETDRVEEVFCAIVPGTHSFALEDNILTGNSYYYLIGGGERSPIDSVSYGILQPDGSVRPESNFEVFRSSGAYTDWVNYEKADSPDNFPGGKYGISPMKAPALNPDRTPYQFPWPSQAAYVEDKKLKVQASGGIADDFHYKLPIKEGSSPKTTYWPEYAVAYTAPAQESSVSMNFTANRGNTLAGDWVDPATFVST